jgi:hypothetical protein
MFYPLAISVILASIFYLALPAVGAFSVRSQWRAFRKLMSGLSLTPFASYAAVAGVSSPEGRIGTFRFFGGIEAIEGENRLWLRNERLSLAVDMTQALIYSLPMGSTKEEGPEEENEITFPDESPERVFWKKLVSVPEKTKVFVGGSLFRDGGLGVFKGEKDSPLIVVLYEGDEETILRRCIWSGRQKNEYWNKITPVSVTAGIFVMILLSFNLVRRPILSSISFLVGAVAVLPILLVLPPGTFLLFLYQALWRRGRVLRAERDAIILPLRYFSSVPSGAIMEKASLPDGEVYGCVRVNLPLEAPLPEGMRIRSDRGFLAGERPDYLTVFGAIKGNEIVRPRDSMADFVAIAGDPLKSSSLCARKARACELLSGACLVLSTLLNALIFWIVFLAVTRK